MLVFVLYFVGGIRNLKDFGLNRYVMNGAYYKTYCRNTPS